MPSPLAGRLAVNGSSAIPRPPLAVAPQQAQQQCDPVQESAIQPQAAAGHQVMTTEPGSASIIKSPASQMSSAAVQLQGHVAWGDAPAARPHSQEVSEAEVESKEAGLLPSEVAVDSPSSPIFMAVGSLDDAHMVRQVPAPSPAADVSGSEVTVFGSCPGSANAQGSLSHEGPASLTHSDAQKAVEGCDEPHNVTQVDSIMSTRQTALKTAWQMVAGVPRTSEAHHASQMENSANHTAPESEQQTNPPEADTLGMPSAVEAVPAQQGLGHTEVSHTDAHSAAALEEPPVATGSSQGSHMGQELQAQLQRLSDDWMRFKDFQEVSTPAAEPAGMSHLQPTAAGQAPGVADSGPQMVAQPEAQAGMPYMQPTAAGEGTQSATATEHQQQQLCSKAMLCTANAARANTALQLEQSVSADAACSVAVLSDVAAEAGPSRLHGAEAHGCWPSADAKAAQTGCLPAVKELEQQAGPSIADQPAGQPCTSPATAANELSQHCLDVAHAEHSLHSALPPGANALAQTLPVESLQHAGPGLQAHQPSWQTTENNVGHQSPEQDELSSGELQPEGEAAAHTAAVPPDWPSAEDQLGYQRPGSAAVAAAFPMEQGPDMNGMLACKQSAEGHATTQPLADDGSEPLQGDHSDEQQAGAVLTQDMRLDEQCNTGILPGSPFLGALPVKSWLASLRGLNSM